MSGREYGSEDDFIDLGDPPEVRDDGEELPAPEPAEQAAAAPLVYRVRLAATNTIEARQGVLWFGA